MALLQFTMPEKVVMEKSEASARFLFRPLETGYGQTVGNALRRVLLSSLEGYAITSIKIPGVEHEFSTIEGVLEDVVDLILNLKQVCFRCLNPHLDDSDRRIFVAIHDQQVFRAGDIERFTTNFAIANPSLEIAHISPGYKLELELTIGKGRGYRPAEENKQDDAPIGEIAIDSIFTPIKNVSYSVENTRVEQRIDYEQLIFDLKTNGTIDPEDALKEAASILIKHFALFSDSTIQIQMAETPQVREIDESFLQMRKLLNTQLSELDLSVRAYNCLKAADIRTLGDLVKFQIADLLKFRNFGKKSLSELEELVASKNLTFGFDVAKYRLDEEF